MYKSIYNEFNDPQLIVKYYFLQLKGSIYISYYNFIWGD